MTKPPKNYKGRPPLLGVKMNEQLQCLVEQTRACGAVINSNIVIGIAGGIVSETSKSLLNDYGRLLNLSKE